MKLETDRLVQNSLRLSREERDHIAGHALDSIRKEAEKIADILDPYGSALWLRGYLLSLSNRCRKIAALSNLLGDIGWEREHALSRVKVEEGKKGWEDHWILGELFPVAQLRPWLEEWQRQDNEALVEAERALEVARLAYEVEEKTAKARSFIAKAQTKLGTGAILLARIEKWMASHDN